MYVCVCIYIKQIHRVYLIICSIADWNECVTSDNDCDRVATCTNQPGTYTCTCPDNYVDRSNHNQAGRICSRCNLLTLTCPEYTYAPMAMQNAVSLYKMIGYLFFIKAFFRYQIEYFCQMYKSYKRKPVDMNAFNNDIFTHHCCLIFVSCYPGFESHLPLTLMLLVANLANTK